MNRMIALILVGLALPVSLEAQIVWPTPLRATDSDLRIAVTVITDLMIDSWSGRVDAELDLESMNEQAQAVGAMLRERGLTVDGDRVELNTCAAGPCDREGRIKIVINDVTRSGDSEMAIVFAEHGREIIRDGVGHWMKRRRATVKRNLEGEWEVMEVRLLLIT